MSSDRCDSHAWASVGVTSLAENIVRVWECEYCPAWTAETLETEDEVPWEETGLPKE